MLRNAKTEIVRALKFFFTSKLSFLKIQSCFCLNGYIIFISGSFRKKHVQLQTGLNYKTNYECLDRFSRHQWLKKFSILLSNP